MGTYINRTSLEDRYSEGEITALEASGVDINLAITDAEAEANTYIATAYTLPLASVDPSLAIKVCDIARYYAYANQGPDEVAKRYEQAIAFFSKVAAGKIRLIGAVADDPETPQNEKSQIRFSTLETPLWTKESMSGW